MTTDTDEKVLCVLRSIVDARVEAAKTINTPEVREQMLDELLVFKEYRNRHTPNGNDPDVEHDDRYKQLIPYIVCVNSKGQILAYNRGWKGGEKRLENLWAIGFGGHVNNQDADWMAGVYREIEEELNLGDRWFTKNYPLHGPIGFLNDDSDDVGRHHLGVVYVLRADEVVPRENPEFGWYHPHEFDLAPMLWPERLESWARLALPMVRAWLESQ